MSDTPPPASAEALDFLKRHDCTFEPIEFMAQVLDAYHAERIAASAEANREILAQNIRDWVEELQPTDLRNRSTAELQDELQRRQVQAGVLCPHSVPWDDCPDCRH